MNMKVVSVLAVLGCAATGLAATLSSQLLKSGSSAVVSQDKITGDYVEARTASVFAGPCHYNGELVTTGRDAIMAWDFSGGRFNGVDLAGVKAMAAVTSDSSLGDDKAARKAELIVDYSASEPQVSAVAALLRAKSGGQLGQIISVRRAPVHFSHGDTGYTVDAAGFASMTVSYRTDNSCCVQPSLVWYTPLAPLDHRKVGYTEVATFTGTVADHWQRTDEDSAFYGSFTF